MAINQEMMLQSLYDSIFGVFTHTPPGGEAGSEADKTFLSLNWPGMPIDMALFGNPWSPNNTEGSMAAIEAFSTLVNKIPTMNPVYSASEKTISQIHEMVVNATVIPPDPDPALKAKYEEAKKYLTMDKTDYDDDTGAKIVTEGDSLVYAKYKKKKQDYLKASTLFLTEYLKYDMAKPEDQRKWSIIGPNLQSSLDTAYEDWVLANKTKVEDNLATIAQSSENQVGQVFLNARNNFNKIQLGSVNNPGQKFHPSYAIPSTWFTSGTGETWTAMTISSESTKLNEHSDFTKYGSSVSASWGLWSASGGFDKSESHEHMDETTSNLKISFKYARVEIDRPWFNGMLYNLGGWKLNAAGGVHSLSDGTKGQKNKTFSLLPTAFIAIRDLEITADWGKKDMDLIEKKLSTKASFGWGPFKISGNYENSSRDFSKSTNFDGTTISSNGLQIIGWISNVMPASPSL